MNEAIYKAIIGFDLGVIAGGLIIIIGLVYIKIFKFIVEYFWRK